VRSGKWGRIRAVVSHNVENWQPTIANTWRDDPQQNPGGFLTDAGSHKLDQLFYVTGLQPCEVFARSQNWGSHVEIVTSASVLLEGDVTATIDFIGHAQYLGEDLTIHCEQAELMIRHCELWIVREGQRERLPVDEPDSNPVASLLDTILHGAEDRSPPSAALPVYDLTQAMLKSGQTGQPVKIAPPNQYIRRTFRLSELTRPDLICCQLTGTTLEGSLREMIDLSLKAGIVNDGETLLRAVMKREVLGSSGIGRGCAVPHTKTTQVDRLYVVIGLSKNGIDWAALDAEEVHEIFLLLSPPDRPGDHLRGLEIIMGFLRLEDGVNFLRQCCSASQIYELLLEFDQTADTAGQ
jgi:PTS system fructose-specific IIA component/PTS system nitrogen regulatory IIA component